MTYSTEQEEFWAGTFGNEYSTRNSDEHLVASNVCLFAEMLRRAEPVESVLEIGCNIGLNLSALKVLLPLASLTGLEINDEAARSARSRLPNADIRIGSLLRPVLTGVWDMVVIKTVLIHVDPDRLPDAYDTLYRHSAKWIVICEYYNPTPVEVEYRGHARRLFKRDFAGEMLDRFADLSLRDYGFRYHRDPVAPVDDMTWFLFEKLTTQTCA